MAKKRNQKDKGNVKNTAITKKIPISNSINTDAIAAALSTINQPVLLKVCRLCETKDGPFLNIFDPDTVTAKKIENVMPFAIAENDGLPHKICFRCTAKVEELYEFIQKCVKTQVSLQTAIGKTGPIPNKVKTRTLWEEKLNQSNISNDDICDALIKKAMQGIKDIPLKPSLLTEVKATRSCSEKAENGTKNNIKEDITMVKMNNHEEDDDGDIPLKKIKFEINKADTESSTIAVTSCKDSQPIEENITPVNKPSRIDSVAFDNKEKSTDHSQSIKTTTFCVDGSLNPNDKAKPFNILDHVSMIKVNGVGVLFQCKLCNRNFLKKAVVLAHGCAKNGGIKKLETVKEPVHVEPPKVPVVKYINTKVESNIKKPPIIEETITLDDDDEDDKPIRKSQISTPKAGPASRVKKLEESTLPALEEKEGFGVIKEQPVTQSSSGSTKNSTPILQFPTMPSLNGRYKLVSGPNNTFTLVEEGTDNSTLIQDKPTLERLRKPPATKETEIIKDIRTINRNKSVKSVDVVEQPLQESFDDQPYPVGLFQTQPHNSDLSIPPQSPSFTTPAMKKQSYTIVQTGNPSKLLISTKPQATLPEVAKKKQRKTKHEVKSDETSKQPFSVTLEDAAPPKDSGFFTFINVDPLLQPSYVLPTDTIIQESQITTSTNAVKQNAESNKDLKYTCNMCDEKFTREKKLLSHIQSHYNKMDEEDIIRTGATKKRGRLSRSSGGASKKH